MRWSFDESFARVTQKRSERLQILAFHVLVALSLVVALRAVGVIMVVGLLTLPALCARVLSSSYSRQIMLMLLVVVAKIVMGFFVSQQLDLNPGPIVMIAGLAVFSVCLAVKRYQSPKNTT